jgi:DNA-binding transcriptional ArsR family regulator
VEVTVARTATNARPGKGREIEDAVSYAIGHGTRIEILAILNEGVRTQTEIARELGLTQSVLQHHIVELLNSDSIEEVDSRQVGNLNLREHRYRALRKGEYSVEDYLGMSEEEQKTTVGITLQNSMAEHLAAFRAGRLRGDDPNLVLRWDWFNVDEQGRAEVTAELEGSWQRLHEIEARSIDRRTRSKEEPQSVVISSIGHLRVRPSRGEQPFGPLVD